MTHTVRVSTPSCIARPCHLPSGCQALGSRGSPEIRPKQACSVQLRRAGGLDARYWRCHMLRLSVPMRARRPTPPMSVASPEAVCSAGNLTSGRVRHRARALYAHSSQVSRAHACWGAAGVPPCHATAAYGRACAADAHPALSWPMRTAPVGADALGVMSATLSPPTARYFDEESMRCILRHTLMRRHTREGRGSFGSRDGEPCGPALSHFATRRRSVPSSRS